MARWLASDNPNGWVTGKKFSVDAPSPTIMHGGMGGDSHGHWHFHNDGREERRMKQTAIAKPPYRALTMADVMGARRNGYTHVSTFSGGGGTCLGYRLAGFKTLMANDCDPRAIACYKANLVDTLIDERPIQELKGADVLKRIGLKRGELDVFEGSPPCTSFSTAGKREKGWGETKHHAGVVQQKIEDLFFEWLRLADELQARVVTAENVSGMVKGTAKGYFKLVLAEMKRMGYRTEARILDAQWLGVPQQRTRIIFIGVREDLGVAPCWPDPLPYRYSIRDALPWLDGTTPMYPNTGFNKGDRSGDLPARALTTGDDSRVAAKVKIEGSTGFDGHAGQSIDEPSGAIMAGRPTRVMHDFRGGFNSKGDVTERPAPAIVAQGAHDLRVVHDTGGQFASEGDVTDRPSPAIRTTDQAQFRVASRRARRANKSEPSPTVLSSDSGFSDVDVGADAGRRKLTILEVKRLCSFPDDYDLEPAGGYAHQWARLGNSVPPMMAYHIGQAVQRTLQAIDAKAGNGAKKPSRKKAGGKR